MNRFGLSFHHLGLAVAAPQPASRVLTDLGYSVGEVVRDSEQNVHVSLCAHPTMPAVEMIWPTETPGPLSSLLKAQTEIAYHLAYLCDGVDEAARRIREAGHRVVGLVPPRPAVLFGGRKVAFYRVAGLGLIELIEADPIGGTR